MEEIENAYSLFKITEELRNRFRSLNDMTIDDCDQTARPEILTIIMSEDGEERTVSGGIYNGELV